MLTRFRTHFTRNTVAYLALFIALGGTSYGFASGSIDSREIKNDTIRTRDLRNNEVRSRDIRNRTILGRDVLNNSLDGDQIDETGLGEVPSATSAESALAVGGVPASQIGRSPASTVNLDDGDSGELLTLQGLGTLRVPTSGACNTAGGVDVGVDVANTSDADIQVFTTDAAGTTWEGDITSSGNSGDFDLTDDPDWLQLRVTTEAPSATLATIDVYFTVEDNQCRVSAQAILSG